MLSLLLRARDEDGEPMTDVELRDELMTMLARRPRDDGDRPRLRVRPAAARTRGARAAARRARAADDDAYLDAVVNETLRLRPVIDAAERTLTEPRTSRGWELPAGIRVYPAIARRPPARGPLPAAAARSGPSASSTRAPSPTRGCRSAAASAAASAPRSPRRRWPR